MRTFDPNKNPYADDLLSLRFALGQRYTPLEQVALGRVIAAKLYELAPGYGRRFWGRQLWRNLGDGGTVVELHVVFNDAIKAGRLYRRLRRYRSWLDRQLIVLIVGNYGVVEVFNGSLRELDRESLAMALDAMRGTGDAYSSGREDAVRPRSDDNTVGDYLGNWVVPRACAATLTTAASMVAPTVPAAMTEEMVGMAAMAAMTGREVRREAAEPAN
jgi:hypothetical protein